MPACVLQGRSASRQLMFPGEDGVGIAAKNGSMRRCAGCVFPRDVDTPVGVEWRERRRHIGCSSPFLASPRSENTAFLPHGQAMEQQIRKKRSLLGLVLVNPLVFAIGAPGRTAFWSKNPPLFQDRYLERSET